MPDTTTQPTEFQKRVYAAVSRIPRGQVSTYKRIGAAIGCSSSRAIGQALRRNPFAPRVPCHRVIASDFTLGGFHGSTQPEALKIKTALLESEGVHFAAGRLSDRERLCDL
jgi:methylated-DNA-[protein]-cysteine S-methyltransferase